MSDLAREATRRLVIERGWRSGTSLEDWAALILDRFGHRPPAVAHQYHVGTWRIDFAWVDLKVALELDGWHHRSPEGAAHDVHRDAVLRARGWLVLRVDDRGSETERKHQLYRVIEVVNALSAQ